MVQKKLSCYTDNAMQLQQKGVVDSISAGVITVLTRSCKHTHTYINTHKAVPVSTHPHAALVQLTKANTTLDTNTAMAACTLQIQHSDAHRLRPNTLSYLVPSNVAALLS
jgi:hypothetical protein